MATQYSNDELIAAAKKASSLGHMLRLLGQNPSSKNQKIAYNRLVKIGIGPDFLKAKRKRLPKATAENALIENSPYSPATIRKLILQMRSLDCCGLNGKECLHKGTNYKWIDGLDVPFHLHHVNGNTRDNRPENLAFICITCHSLTENFGGKSNKAQERELTPEEEAEIEKMFDDLTRSTNE